MSTWPLTPLEQLTDPERPITYGVVKPGDEHLGDGVRFIRGGDVSDGRINIAALRTISKAVSAQYKRTLLKGGELVVSLVGYPGQVAIVPPELAGANLARQVGLVALTSAVDARFVKYALMSPTGRSALLQQTTGTAQQVINLANLKKVPIPLAPLAVQRRIGSILGAYDDLIEINRQRIAILEEMARRLFDEWFAYFRFPGHEAYGTPNPRGGPLPLGWRNGVLGDLIALQYGRALPTANRRPGSVPVIGSSGIVGSHDEALVTGPGIIVGRKGNVGSTTWSDCDFFPIDTVFFVETELPKRFIFQVLKRQTFLNSDAAVPGLNRAGALRNEVVIPPTSLMAMFDALAEPLLRLAAILNESNIKLAEARNVLLPRLMSGEMVVQTLVADSEISA